MSLRMMQWALGSSPLLIEASDVVGNDSGFPQCGDPGSTNTPGVSVSNGSGTYTYLWEKVGASAERGPFVCSNSAAQNPTWRTANNTACANDEPDTEAWRVTVTDTVWGKAAQKTISVTIFWTSMV